MRKWSNLQLLEYPRARVQQAAAIIRAGGLVACPTEGVWGLACSPYCESAVVHMLSLKRRSWRKGLIVVAAWHGQLEHWINHDLMPAYAWKYLQQPTAITWVVPATAAVPELVRGAHAALAIRITAHPLLRDMCREAGPVISTSANISGYAPVRNRYEARCVLGRKLDMVVAGETGGLRGPTEMRDVISGEIIRAQQLE